MSRLDEARERLERFRSVTLPHNGLSAHPLEDDVALLLRSEADLRAALTQSAEKLAVAGAKIARDDMLATPSDFALEQNRMLRERAEKAERERDALLLTGNPNAVNCDGGSYPHTVLAIIKGTKCPACEVIEHAGRLERTVERMREALRSVLPGIGQDECLHKWTGANSCEICTSARSALAASSPDHAGAPETFTGNTHATHGEHGKRVPSVEAGEGDK